MSFTQPRRTTKTTSTPTPTVTPPADVSRRSTVNTTMAPLRKSATFHSPSSPTNEVEEGPFNLSSLQRSLSSLEYHTVESHRRRAADAIESFDINAVGNQSSSTRSRRFRDESDPLPRGVVNVENPSTKSYDTPLMEGIMPSENSSLRRSSRRRTTPRYADSGIGSSIRSSSSSVKRVSTDDDDSRSTKPSTVTRSADASSTTIKRLPRLSARTTHGIHKHILKPLLAKKSFRDLHPLVEDCPRRIHQKEIVCLRDLEKTLIFTAPVSETHHDVALGVAHWFSRLKKYTKSAALYLDFCLESIRCIQATVELVNEREQVRPNDRPYTNGYFVDLVEQIQQYAEQVREAKEKEEKGETLDEMDAHPSDEIKLHGGLTRNGRPAELVRINKKTGKAVSIATGKPVDMDDDDNASMRFKRSLSEGVEDDESVMRSMARRKKDASAAELAPKFCREPGCEKSFKRPCDLTKHEKTHSRPWKCPVTSCKYHEYGWPTEKEMDRHQNDKHSAAPPLFECHFKPCPYRSKRESNCKQHMEKAHGWEYVRSKNNGKNRPAAPAIHPHGLPTPQATIIHTPGSDSNHGSPLIVDDEMLYENTSLYTTNHSIDFFPPFPPEMNMFQPPQSLNIEYSPVTNNSYSTDGQSPFDANSPFNPTSVLGAQDQFQENIQSYSPNNDEWAAYEQTDLYSAPAQVQIPSNHHIYQEMGQNPMVFETSGVMYQAQQQQQQQHQHQHQYRQQQQQQHHHHQQHSQPMTNISPINKGNAKLYTPKSIPDFDEGFDDFVPGNSRMATNGAQDFQLFSAPQQRHSSNPAPLFGEITPQVPLGFPGILPQDLIAFYAQNAVSPATVPSNHQPQNHYQHHHHQHQQQQQFHQNMNMSMDWSSDEYGYSSH
ncbi:hypothetical protein DSL72_002226 [Monilinia vaccinii-corymbosi]|uniref:C2H2-type domain-containing protein n=1 Tax=Monilinia vaccinii-corymbosi TaxID=61207 RepID=A0A8A3PC24_9HELO|nr:hypothetical protein DSL72_002226 [Monilinia vaccinii-corymbosi]